MRVDDPLVSKLPDVAPFLRKTFSFNIRGFDLSPEYWQAIVILGLIFVLVFSVARYRHLYVKWSMSNFVPTFLLGFMIAIVFEGFLIVGGRTLFTEIMGWDNVPKPISTALDEGRNRLVEVLGITEEIPDTLAKEDVSYQSVIRDYESLSEAQAGQVKLWICEPPLD